MLYLYGDSILDNAPYVALGDAVVDQLHHLIGANVVLCARDGAVVRDTMVQIARQQPLHGDVAVLSVGGNDLLNIADRYVMVPAPDMNTIIDAVRRLHIEYQRIVARLVASCQHVVLCTVYIPPDLALIFAPISDMTLVHDVVRHHNQLVADAAQQFNAQLLDLTNVCTEPDDFVHIIEPSARGGAKIVNALLQFPFVKRSE